MAKTIDPRAKARERLAALDWELAKEREALARGEIQRDQYFERVRQALEQRRQILGAPPQS